MIQDDPNFPAWAQRAVLAIVGTVIAAVVGAVGFTLYGVISWINSGSH